MAKSPTSKPSSVRSQTATGTPKRTDSGAAPKSVTRPSWLTRAGEILRTIHASQFPTGKI